MKIPYGNLLLCKSIFKYKYNFKKKKVVAERTGKMAQQVKTANPTT